MGKVYLQNISLRKMMLIRKYKNTEKKRINETVTGMKKKTSLASTGAVIL